MAWQGRWIAAVAACALAAGCSQPTADNEEPAAVEATASAASEAPTEVAAATEAAASEEASEAAEATEAPTPTPKDDRAAIRETFDTYIGAIVGFKGDAAADLLASETLAYYGHIQDMAAFGGPRLIKSRMLLDRLTVALYRASLSPRKIARMNPEEIYAWGVREGLLESKTIAAEELGKIDLSGRLAYARVRRDGKKTDYKYEFIREDDGWKINPVTMYGGVNFALKQTIQKEGLGEDEFIFAVVETITGKSVGPEIYGKPKNTNPDDDAEADA